MAPNWLWSNSFHSSWGWQRGEWRTLCSLDPVLLSFWIVLCQSRRTLQLLKPLGFLADTYMMALQVDAFDWIVIGVEHHTQQKGVLGYIHPFIHKLSWPSPIGRTDHHGLGSKPHLELQRQVFACFGTIWSWKHSVLLQRLTLSQEEWSCKTNFS